MRYLKEFKIFENFEDIHAICKRYRIINYNINIDGSVDVEDNVDLSYLSITKLPLKFGRVKGDFYCNDNQLTSLEGAPRHVNGNFSCVENQLTSLEGCPEYVGGYFSCSGNPIFEIWKLFRDKSKIEVFNEYDIVREVDGKPAIVLDRLNAFLEEIGKPPKEKKYFVLDGWINI
jgi:hypothetical protein